MVDSWNAAQLNEAVNNGSIGGGNSLPKVTASDNGDVLTVVEGAWAKATPSAGYSPNYSETEALVGSKYGVKDVYGRLVPITSSSIGTSIAAINGTLTFPDVELLLDAKVIWFDSTKSPRIAPILAYIDQRENGDHKLYAQGFTSYSLTSTTIKVAYIEYTKVTPAPAE